MNSYDPSIHIQTQAYALSSLSHAALRLWGEDQEEQVALNMWF